MTAIRPRGRSLGAKLLTIYASVVFATMLVMFLVLEFSRYRQEVQDLIGQIDEIASIQVEALSSAVWQLDSSQIERTLDSLARIPSIRSAHVVDEKGTSLGRVGKPAAANDPPPFYEVERALTAVSQGNRRDIGKLAIVATDDEIWEGLHRRLLIDGMIFATILGAVLAATAIATRSVIGRPLDRLRAAIERSREDQVVHPIEWTSDDELGRVVKAYNDLQMERAAAEQRLREHQGALEKLVAERTEELTQKTSVLQTVLDGIASGLMAIDGNFVVRIINATFIEFYQLPKDAIRAGVPLRDILMVRARRGDYGPGDPDALADERLLKYRMVVERYVDRLPGGRIVEVIRTPTSDGGLVLLAEDVTERVRAQEALAREKVILETTLDNMAQGISFVDRDLNLVAFNSKFIELLEFPPDVMKPGISLEQVFRFNAQRGEYGPGDVEGQVRERMALAAKMQPHQFQRTRPSGMILDIRGRPAGDMGFVTTYTNITDQVRAENELRDKLSELERFNRLAIDRELRMIELKRQINDLQKAMGREAEYVVVD